MKNMCAVIPRICNKDKSVFFFFFLAVCYASVKGMTDNRFGISEVIVQQNLFFSPGIQSFSLAILYMTNILVGALIIYK